MTDTRSPGFSGSGSIRRLSKDRQDVLLTGRNFLMRADRVDFYNQAVLPAKPASAGGASQTVLCSKPSDDNRETLIHLGVQDLIPQA